MQFTLRSAALAALLTTGVVAAPSVWTSVGCYTDHAGTRTLAAATLVNATMTIEKCQAFCDAGSYGFSGVEYGSECYCDYSIQYQGASTTPTVCNVKCGGNINQTCGGAGAISVFSSGKPLPTIPAAVVGTNATSWAYQGCFTDNSIGTRTLALRIAPAAGGVTPQTCVNTCQSAGQSVAGVEFGTECWCGNVVSASATKVADNQCGTACTSNPSFFCGDDNRLNVWKRAV